jgi:stage II sporulation protein D
MKIWTKILFVLSLFLLTQLFSEKFRICITWSSSSFPNTFANKTQFYFRANPTTAQYKILSSDKSVIYVGTAEKYLQVNGSNIYVEGIGTFTPPLYVQPVDTTSTFVSIRRPDSSTFRTYRGEYEVRVNNGYLMVINIVELEDYLCGVLPNEIGSTAPIEAQKAQAVVSRTATYGKREGAHTTEPFDLCSTMHCQVYGNDSSNKGGKDTERSTSNSAVYQTSGLVIKYSGQIAKWVNYFACCGGTTANNEDVWGSYVAYLRSIVDDPDKTADSDDTDDYCYYPTVNSYPYYYWTLTISSSDLETKLKSNSATTGSGSLTGISVAEYDVSGRAKYVDIYYTGGTKRVRGDNFRAAVGYSTLKSTKFTVTYNSPNYIFSGKGYGHGVGMCQRGAIGMANAGKKYDEIIKHYFTSNVVIEDIAPPIIYHTPVEKSILGSSITIVADVIDSNEVSSVKLYYKKSSDATYYFKSMVKISSVTYQEFIPASFATAVGINYYIEATDIKNNKSTTQVYFINISTHTIGPEIIHTPQSSVLQYTYFPITCKVSDPDGVKQVYLFYKNSLQTSFIRVVMGTTDYYNFSYTIEPSQVTLGEFKYYIVAYDNFDYYSSYGDESNPIVVMVVSSQSVVDTTGPNISHNIVSTYTFAGQPLQISCSVTDQSGVKSVSLYYKNSYQTNYNLVTMQNVGNNTYVYTIPSSDIVEGILRYYISATDVYNNVSYYPSLQEQITIVVKSSSAATDSDGPKVVFEPITELRKGYPLEITVYVEDDSGVKDVYFYYKNINETSYKQKIFSSLGGGWYQLVISSDELLTSTTFQYFIIATDIKDNSTVLPPNAPNETYKVVIISDGGKIVKDLKDKIIIVKSQPASIKIDISQFSSSISKIKFVIYSLSGKIVREESLILDKVLVDNNTGEISWDGKDNENNFVPPGIYLYKLELNNKLVKSGKIVVIR